VAEIALTGTAATAFAGLLASSFDGTDSSPSLVGTGVTAINGSLSLSASYAMTGEAGTGGAGTLIGGGVFALTGEAATSARGMLGVDVTGGTAVAPIIGLGMTAFLGDINIGSGIVTIRITQSAETPYVFVSHHSVPDVKFSEVFTVNVPTTVEAEIETALLDSKLGWEKLVDDEVTETHPATY
jgi:hypothetical protein